MPKKDNAPKPEAEKPEEQIAAPERPSWLPEGYDAPEKFAAEAQSWRERATKAEEFEKKFGTLDTFPERITAAEAKLREAIRAEYEAKQQPQTKQTNPDDAFADWENLAPTEQARRLQAITAAQLQQHLDETVGKYWQQGQAEINKGLKTSQDQMNLLIRGYDISRQTGIPVEKIWPVLEDLATAPTDRLMNLAVQQLQAPTQQDQKIKEAVAAERAKWDTEQRNREQANMAATRPASYRELHKAAERGPDGRITKQSIRDAVFQKYANGEIPRG